MRCSNCFRLVKPVVALDIDGTLGDYHSHFTSFAVGFLGARNLIGKLAYTGAEPFRDWFCGVFEVDLTTFRSVKLAYRQGGQKRTMPPYAGAARLPRYLSNRGAEVWLTTTRPHDRYDRVDPDTRDWLARHDIYFDGLLFDGDKMEALSDIVEPERVIAVLDDQVDVLREAETKFGRRVPLLRRTPYNSAVLWRESVTVCDLEEAGSKIATRIDEWKGRYK